MIPPLHPGRVPPLLLSSLLLCAVGCSYQTDKPLFQPTASTTGYYLVAAQPVDGAMAVPLDAPIVLTMSDFPDPATSTPQNLTLTAAGAPVDATVSVDLVTVSLVITPSQPLAPMTKYTVTLTRNLSSLGKAMVTTQRTLAFTTGTQSGGGDGGAPRVPTFTEDIRPLFDHYCDPNDSTLCGSCNASTCHAGSFGAGMLDLDDSVAYANLISEPSVEVNGIQVVTRDDPANSSLLRMLVGTPDVKCDCKMPADGIPFTPEELRLVSDWIAGGAPEGPRDGGMPDMTAPVDASAPDAAPSDGGTGDATAPRG